MIRNKNAQTGGSDFQRAELVAAISLILR